MAETHQTEHHGPNVSAYFKVFGALAVFTLISFLVNFILGRGSFAGFTIILLVAICKAVLVAMIFMHLLLDWKRVYIMIVPALVLGPMLMIVLLPDIVLAWRHFPPTMVP